MATTTTMPTGAPAAELPFHLTLGNDPSPVVRLIGQALRRARGARHAHDVLGCSVGTVTVRSHDTPQVATIAFRGGMVEVTPGVAGEPGASVVVDLNSRFASTEEPAGDAALAAGVLLALRPPVPDWRDAAARFWEVTRHISGIPDVLDVHAVVPDGSERARFGEGATSYGITGPADLLAGVFSGADDFLVSLSAGLQVQGTLSQLSVMTAASWKVRFDV